MDWTRTILDGLVMAAYFNLFAAAVALYKPRLMLPLHPPAIIKAAEKPPTKDENRFYWLWGIAPPSSLWCGQHCGGRDNRILASGPGGIMPAAKIG